MRDFISGLRPDAVAVSGDLTQRCTNGEFRIARQYLDSIEKITPYVVIPGNHDIRWLGAVARNLGFLNLLRQQAHDFKYSRYTRYIQEDLSPSLEVPGAVIAGLNTSHGITRGSLTRRFKDLGVIGYVSRRDIERVERAFESADSSAARVVMIHHNPIKGEASSRHGLANTEQALQSFAALGAELILCGHDHQQAVHTVERGAHGVIVSTAGTISNRLRPGRAPSFNLVDIDEKHLRITAHNWKAGEGFIPSDERIFSRSSTPRQV